MTESKEGCSLKRVKSIFDFTGGGLSKPVRVTMVKTALNKAKEGEICERDTNEDHQQTTTGTEGGNECIQYIHTHT